jgi:hypothetical protein
VVDAGEAGAGVGAGGLVWACCFAGGAGEAELGVGAEAGVAAGAGLVLAFPVELLSAGAAYQVCTP